jgi:hypothetical protein
VMKQATNKWQEEEHNRSCVLVTCHLANPA